MTVRKSSYRSLASLHRDLSRCRACTEAGYRLESLPVRVPGPAGAVGARVPGRASSASPATLPAQLAQWQRAYMFGQAPGPVEGVERLPWRGDAGRKLRGWLGLDEEEFYEAFYCASVTRCDPGRAATGRGDRTPTPREQELCSFWHEWELELLRPRLIVTVGGLALKRLLGLTPLTPHVGERYELDGAPVVPFPHSSGASSWLNDPANKSRLERAIALVHAELARL